MQIQINNTDELYYKYDGMLSILKEWKIELVSSSKTDDIIELEFKNEADYLKTFNEICIIPIEHVIIAGD